MVVFVIDKMHGATADFISSIKHGLMDMVAMKTLATIGRNKRGVDVHDFVVKVRGYGQQPQKPGHDHQIGLHRANGSKDLV